MKSSWRFRQIGIVSATAILLLFASTLRELGNTFKQTLGAAAIEARLVAEGVVRELIFLAADSPQSTVVELTQEPRVRRAMLDAQSTAPSVVHVAIYDTSGRILAHTLQQREGEAVEPGKPLPRALGVFEAWSELLRLWRQPSDYSTELPLVTEGDAPVAVIRVVSAGAFLLHDVEETFRRGTLSIFVLVAVAGIAGGIAARATSRQLRELEAGIVALREGRHHELHSDSGWEDFDRVARELNRLGEQFVGSDGQEDDSRLRAVDLLGDAVLVLDADGSILFANELCYRRLGIATNAARTIDALLPSDHLIVRMVRRLLDRENRNLVAPLSESADAFVAVGHRIDDGPATAGIVIEIKEAGKQAELSSRIQQSRVMAHLGQMAAGVAHEIRGPLQGLEFDLEKLQSSLDEPEAARATLEELRGKIRRLEWVVGGFLKVARVRPLRLSSLPPMLLLREVCDSLQTDAVMAGVELSLDETDDLPVLIADRDTLSRAIENIVGNAIEAQPSRDGRVVVHCRGAGDRVEISVRDSGPGIPEDRRSEIFDLYFTTKPRGTGVGLAVVRQAVELHNGDVRIDSDPDVGTTVTLSLPAAPTL